VSHFLLPFACALPSASVVFAASGKSVEEGNSRSAVNFPEKNSILFMLLLFVVVAAASAVAIVCSLVAVLFDRKLRII